MELLYRSAKPKDGGLYVTRDDALQLSQCSAMRYDREGDDHYDLLSALHKSIRGSDPDAAVYYLGRLLVAGDLISPCRRLLCIAAEDIGLAYPHAITVTKSCVDAALQLGLPEARLPLAEAAVLLATAPKSNSAHNAIIAAMEDIQRGAVGDIPRHLKNGPRRQCRARTRPPPINTHTITRTTMCSSAICRSLWGIRITMRTAKTRPSRPPGGTGTTLRGRTEMDLRLHDVLELKKEHPCGSKRWQVLRVGMDIKLRCLGCGHEVMQPRRKIEKMIRRIVPKEELQ